MCMKKPTQCECSGCELNCHCDNCEPDGEIKAGESEGRYELCKNCGKRIWY